jgi:putative hydrolase of the HAD superfamily
VWRVYEDVLPTLQALRARGFKLAALSNWDERLRPLLQVLGLAEYFEVIVVSGEIGHHKPSPAIYAQAAQALNLPPGQILHIGDGQREDWEGARQAGFGAFWLNRQGTATGEQTLTRLDELLERVALKSD